MNDGGNNQSNNGGRKRRRKNGNGVSENDNVEQKQQPNNKGSKEMMITSFLLLEEQEKQEKQEWDEFSHQEKSKFETNHKKKTQAMLDYYSNMQNHYVGLEETNTIRRKRSRAVANSAVVGASAVDKQCSGSSVSHQRRLWVKDRSKAWWDECNSPDFPETEFKKWFRMGKATFELICDELKSAVAKEDTMLRAAIPVDQRVAVCIYRLATGDPLRLVSKQFGLGISTCHKIVLDVCAAIRSVLMPKYLQWPDEESSRRIKEEFESISGIPNIVGAMYTTHIPIIAPKISVAAYFNKRHTERNQKTSYSITVQGVVDPKGVFNDVCIGWPGSMPDDKVLEKSALYQRGTQGLLKGVWIVGGSSYPLMDWTLVPYNQHNLTWTQHAFNEKIGEIQSVSKDAFARLKGRWRCLQKRTEVKLQELPVVLGACCVLHNLCEMRGEGMEPDSNFELFDDEMVSENPLQSISSMKARDSIAHNLLHHGLAGTGFL
ncbi:protein ANTAGONIST OF LIKE HETEROCHROMATIN PROTEIN 1-like [Amaranthus tricolor]|uniref:protein ANTAGONIST OF LIKE HETEROCHROMATIN PROTEIN 1-like n=1 Tax=Amaranthus tricolor TaxID=29722 RepID=UPI0025886270|nr:protein ANTAGONIST OF LIKE HETEROCHROMATIN PROTEIN 1-like [Amaranthus tricolor]